MGARYSVWAVVSVLLNVPWVLAVLYVLRVYARTTGAVAGEIWLLPLMAWGVAGLLAGAVGIVALVVIRGSGGRLKGQWIAVLGVGIAALVPTFGVTYVVADWMR